MSASADNCGVEEGSNCDVVVCSLPKAAGAVELKLKKLNVSSSRMAIVRSFVYCWEPGTHCCEDARRANSSSKGACSSGMKLLNCAKCD